MSNNITNNNGKEANTSIDKQNLDMLARAAAARAAADKQLAAQGITDREPTAEEHEAADAMLQLSQAPKVPPGGMPAFEASMKAGQDAVERPRETEKK